MLFNSLVFPVFLLMVLTIYWWLDQTRHRKLLLLVASYVFYGWWDWRFLSLIVFSTAVDYFCGLALGRLTRARDRKLVLAVSLGANFGLLGTFKYFNFFAASLAAVLGQVGFHPDWPTLNVVLPVGISFYTFQSVSYALDVYRGKCAICKDSLTFFLFVSYFPQLVAGPIERARDLTPQLDRRATFDEARTRLGLRHILWGFVLKCVLADNLAPVVNEIYRDPSARSGADLLFATYCFAFQIYGDFAGYSSIALGTAALFGVSLTRNFHCPYLSRSVREFWTRWHITLSTWFREYLYVWALGGNQLGRARQALNVLSTFVLSGLWHGANWTFVAWGALNGVFYFLGEPFRRGRLSNLANTIIIFHLTCLGWVFFRSRTLAQAIAVCWRISSDVASILGPSLFRDRPELSLLALSVLGIEYLQRDRESVVHIDGLPRAARLAVYQLLLLFFFFAGSFERTPFIYFQF